jgi:hypothetical protein
VLWAGRQAGSSLLGPPRQVHPIFRVRLHKTRSPPYPALRSPGLPAPAARRCSAAACSPLPASPCTQCTWPTVRCSLSPGTMNATPWGHAWGPPLPPPWPAACCSRCAASSTPPSAPAATPRRSGAVRREGEGAGAGAREAAVGRGAWGCRASQGMAAAAAGAWAGRAACPTPLPAFIPPLRASPLLFFCCSTGGFEEPLIARHPQAAAAAASEEAEGTSAGLDGVPPGGASMERGGDAPGADYEPWLVTYNYSQVGCV